MRRITRAFQPAAIFFVGLLCIHLASDCFAQANSSEQRHLPKGTWILRSIYWTPNIQGPTLSQQNKLLNTSVILSDDEIKACGVSTPINSIEVNHISSDDFLANTRVRFNWVGIDTPIVTEIVINHASSGNCFGAFPIPGQDVYVKSRDELLIDFEGVFYRAVRVK
ncbi:hypothetical protein [Dyella sp. 2HG41-7]|uniref:hypothetical protein n=1 Tax=Dyella sp. 2HG41-7 TaxID=2883239 RepID=UPI001F42C088|nr:hypothetical protein [Dyella sp. 2HG41-7]